MIEKDRSRRTIDRFMKLAGSSHEGPTLTPDHEFFDGLEASGLDERQIETIRKLHTSLACRLDRNPVSYSEVVKGWESVKALIPRVDQTGTKWIADRRITPQWGARIKSRTECPSTSVYDKVVGWASLPEKVKQHMVNNVMIALQFSPECTTNCHFCGYAEHGPLSSLFSVDSIKEYLKEYKRLHNKNNQKVNTVPLYDASDPLDHPRFTDIYQACVDILGPDFSFYVSTAVPLGSEIELLRYFMLLENKKYTKQHERGLSPRISRTKLNAARVDHIRNVVDGLYGVFNTDRLVGITRPRDGDLRLGTPEVWSARTEEIRMADINSVSCADHVIMSPSGLHFKTLQLACLQFPNGQKKEDVITQENDSIRIRYPDHVYNVQQEPLPEVILHTHVVDDNGKVETNIEVVLDSFRTAKRIATYVTYYNDLIRHSTKKSPGEYFRENVTEAEIKRLRSLVGQGNQSAQFLLGYLIHNRFITPNLQ